MTRATRSPITPIGAGGQGAAPNQFGAAPAGPAPDPGAPDFAAIQRSREFGVIRRRLRRFVFPMTFLFFAWYMVFVLLAAFAPGIMSRPVLGSINFGIVLGLLQFVSLMLITTLYSSFMKRRIDPAVAEIRRKAGVDDQ